MSLVSDRQVVAGGDDDLPAGGGVYLICFDEAFKHARHYIGWTVEFGYRIKLHRAAGSKAARLMVAVSRACIGWRVVAVWPGADRDLERRLKSRGGAARICPVCKGG